MPVTVIMCLKTIAKNGYKINNQPQLVTTVVFESLSNSNLRCKRHIFLFPSNGKVTTLPVPRAGKKMTKLIERVTWAMNKPWLFRAYRGLYYPTM